MCSESQEPTSTWIGSDHDFKTNEDIQNLFERGVQTIVGMLDAVKISNTQETQSEAKRTEQDVMIVNESEPQLTRKKRRREVVLEAPRNRVSLREDQIKRTCEVIRYKGFDASTPMDTLQQQ